MTNKLKQNPPQAIDFPSDPGVHIAGVTCSSHVSPTIPFQPLSQSSGPDGTEEFGATVPKRFWAKVAVGAPHDCWLWQASVDRYGYGRAVYNGKYISASRLAFILATGNDHAGFMVCHHCNTPRCCNPSHLYAGTQSDNERDKFRAGRKTHRGDGNPARKLSAEQVNHVRSLFQQGMTNVAIGKLLGVHHSTISKIRTGKSWDSSIPLGGIHD